MLLWCALRVARLGLSMQSKNILFVAFALIYATAGQAQITLNTVPTREVGQAQSPELSANPFAIPNGNPNLVEGREIYSPTGIALDTSVTPPRLYVAHSANNRRLSWMAAVN